MLALFVWQDGHTNGEREGHDQVDSPIYAAEAADCVDLKHEIV